MALMLLLLAGCGSSALPSSAPPTAPDSPAPTKTPAPAETIAPDPESTPEQTPKPTAAPVAWREIFEDFLRGSFSRLNELCLSGIAGVGFIDLDLDGVPELLIFDAGASASMGLQFFDIIEEDVFCVSANIEKLGEEFGGKYFDKDFVNANFFEDFRYYKSTETGEAFFLVVSSNGAEDFSYSRLVRFTGDGGILGLESLFFKYESFEFSSESDGFERSGADYLVGGNAVSSEEYEQALSAFMEKLEDQGYSAAGEFVWGVKDYSGSLEEFMSLVVSAAEKYVPVD